MRMVWFQFLVLHLFKQFRKRLVRWPLPGIKKKRKEKLRNERLLGKGGEGEGYAVLETKWELQLLQKAAGG